MTVEVTKLTSFSVTGPVPGVAVSKLVAYVVLYPGVEAGATPPNRRAHSYAQRVRNVG